MYVVHDSGWRFMHLPYGTFQKLCSDVFHCKGDLCILVTFLENMSIEREIMM
jgi:hypothetical protein